MKSRVTAVVGLLVVAASVFAYGQATPTLEGAWRVTEVSGSAANDTGKTPQPGLYIFTKKHYSVVAVVGSTPRKDVAPAQDPQKLTDAEKAAQYEAWALLTANAGTYEVKGTTLTTNPLVAKNPSVMGRPQTREFKIDGKTLTLTQKSTTQPVTETRTVLTRVE